MKTVNIIANERTRPVDLLRKKLGCKGRKLGSGAYATVWRSSSEKRVVKLGYIGDPYLTYVKWVRRQKPCKFLPKIHELYLCKDHDAEYYDDGVYAVVMERLYEPVTARQGRLRRVCSDIFYDIADGIGNIKHARDYLAHHKITMTNDKLKQIMSVSRRINTVADKDSVGIDMHPGNMMFRRNGQLIFTDPFSN